MAKASSAVDSDSLASPGADLVDPRAPRFGQGLTATGLTLAIGLQAPILVYAVAAVLLAAVVSGWRVDLYGLLWRRALVRVVGRPDEREPAAPHRFAKLLGASFTAVASALLLAGIPLAGYAVAGAVALLAGVAAVLDVCVGCRMYRQVGFFRGLGVV